MNQRPKGAAAKKYPRQGITPGGSAKKKTDIHETMLHRVIICTGAIILLCEYGEEDALANDLCARIRLQCVVAFRQVNSGGCDITVSHGSHGKKGLRTCVWPGGPD